jgi:hypothetical protein
MFSPGILGYSDQPVISFDWHVAACLDSFKRPCYQRLFRSECFLESQFDACLTSITLVNYVTSSGGGLTVKLDLDAIRPNAASFDGTLQYAFAKRAQMMLTELWAKKLPAAGVSVHCMHPGYKELYEWFSLCMPVTHVLFKYCRWHERSYDGCDPPLPSIYTTCTSGGAIPPACRQVSLLFGKTTKIHCDHPSKVRHYMPFSVGFPN